MRLNFRLVLPGTLLFLLPLLARARRYEAENGTLTGGISVQTTVAGYSGTGYAGIFQNDGDAVVTFTLSQGGWYKLYIGYAGPYGDKKNILGINGNSIRGLIPGPAAFTETPLESWLKEGSNTLSMTKSWGWFLFDYFRIEPDTIRK
jgi:mannan endo-1,4-beta-mannosidase